MNNSSETIGETAIKGSSLLWEVTGCALKRPSFFLGTMHLMCEEDAVLSENTKKVITAVEQVYLEADINNMEEMSEGAISLKMENEASLEHLLTPQEFRSVKDFFEQYQPYVPFEALAKQQPLMLSSSLYDLFLPCEHKNGIDLKVIEEANRHNKPIKGLETIAFQASLFNTIPYEEQAKELVKTIENIGKFHHTLQEMTAVYRSEDIEELYALTLKEESGVSAFTDELLYKRNKNWVEKFAVIAEENATLFAVGAGHLGGPEGVINLLKKQGFGLRPITNE